MCCIMRQCFGVGSSYGSWLGLTTLASGWDVTIHTKDKHKFSTPWEGPFIVVDVVAPGAYVLAEVDGSMLPNTWNVDQLCKYYI
jgi:hypothetical protein